MIQGIAAASLLVTLAVTVASAAGSMTFQSAFRSLDGEQFLEDEPIWFCVEDDVLERTGSPWQIRLVGIEDAGVAFREDAQAPMDFTAVAMRDAQGNLISPPPLRVRRAGEFSSKFNTTTRGELFPLFSVHPGLRAGRYEVRRTDADTARAIATFQVVAPRGSELSVRAGLARVGRLLADDDPASLDQAAILSNAILERYPRSSYRTIVYIYVWVLKSGFSESGDSGTWLEEAFAHFHDSCFGVWALEQAVRRGPSEDFYKRLRRLVGLYPDTKLARAAVGFL